MLEHEMQDPATDPIEQGCEAAYSAGYNACHDNKPLTTNPHQPDSPLWHEWKNGWTHYDADYNPIYYEGVHW